MTLRAALLGLAALALGAAAPVDPAFQVAGAVLGMTLADYRAAPVVDSTSVKPELFCLPDPRAASEDDSQTFSCFWMVDRPEGSKPILLPVEGFTPVVQSFNFARPPGGGEPILFAIDMRFAAGAAETIRAALTARYGPPSDQPILSMPGLMKPLSAPTWRRGDERVWVHSWGDEFTLRYEIVSVAKANNAFVQ